MKKILGLLIILTSFSAAAQNTFSISSESEQVGNSFTLNIGLANSTEVTAFQFDLSHNENAYQLSSGSALTTRAENHTLTVSTVDDNTIRVLVYSASNEVINTGNGIVLSLTFSSENEPGTYNLSMSDIVLSDQNGASVSSSATSGSVTLLGPRYNLTTTAVNFGEIPIDSSPTQSVSITNSGNENLVITSYAIDAPFSIAQTLPVSITPGNSSSFTVGVDTSTKQEVTSELTFSTNDQDPLRAIQSTTIQSDIFAVNEIHIGFGQGESNSEIIIPVTISNMESFSGFQFDITLPNDVIYVENSTVFSTRSEDHSIAASMINTNTLRFVSYSGSNTNFTGNDGEVFSFKIIPNITSGTYTLPINNPIISNVELGDITSDVYNGSFTINAPYLSTSIQTINYGNVPITEVQTTNITLTNTGSATLMIDELVFNTGELTFPLDIPTTLEVNESTIVALEYAPTQTGSFNENISIRNNSPEEQLIINVLANVFSPNYLTLTDMNVFRGNSYDIPINLVNNENIRAIQYDLNIPEGFTFDIDNVVETSILNNFTTSISSLGNNNYYTDRLYENKGQGNFVKNTNALPNVLSSGLRVSPCDFDKDGDIDLFVGGRVLPGSYGRPIKSYLLENNSSNGVLKFIDVTKKAIPEMVKHTMVTASVWGDIDKDGDNDLIVANEWGPIELFENNLGTFKNESKKYGLSEHVGWWSSIAINDIDNDGDLDIVAGNLGLNYKYKASFETPFYMYLNDFDANNTDDIVLAYSQENIVYPVRGRSCASGQMPFVKEKFKTYNSYGSASVKEIYGEKLISGITYKSTYFASALLTNENGKFLFNPFENKAQLSSVNKILIHDFNNDLKQDILLLGNLYGAEVETPRNDASYGTLLSGKDSNQFEITPNYISNLWADGDIKDAVFINIGTKKAFLIAKNNAKLSLILIE